MKRYTLYIIALVSAVACQREIALQEPAIASGEQFTATVENTRTAISSDTATGDCHISWTNADAAKIYYGAASTTAAVDGVSASSYDADNLSATFVTSAAIPDNVTDLYAVYPSSAASSFTSGTSTLSVTIPSTQTATFQAANYMVAKGARADHTLPFHHLASYLEIKVTGASVSRIVIAGENGEAIAGTLPVTFNGAGVPLPGTATATATSITLNVSGAGNYYAALLPGVSFTKGLSIRFYDSSGNILNSYCHQNALTTARAHIDYFTDDSGIDGRSRYFYATVSGAGAKDGSSWANAMSQTELYEFLSNAKLKQNGVLTVLTDAQKDALDGATVRLGAGTYTMGAIIDLQNLCTTTNKTLSLVGGYPAAGGATANPATNVTAFSGNDSYRVLNCYLKNTEKKLTLNLSGITFCHSKGTSGGAAAVSFFGEGNSVMISNCVFSDNYNTNSIAGIHIADGSVVRVEDSQFLRNTAWAGAAANVDGADAKGYFTDCVFSGNQSTSGSGGACKLSETATGVMNFTNCTFTANKGNDYGGAFYCNAPASASATFTNCTFGVKNDAGKKNYADTHGGGAVYIGQNGYACTVSFTGCEFYGNTAKSGGGAIHVSNALNASSATCLSNVNLTNCTFEGNSVTYDASTMSNGSGGAVDFRSSGTLTIRGCTFKQNATTQTGA
ncbi:MAG: hypothetical protein IJU13_07000, partial [Bacteroidales bacterium]|nr:hypothetical protein [Bacteroidales bacterium]